MNQPRLIPVVLLTAALLGSPGLPTFMPSVGTAAAQKEEQVQTKNRGMKRSQGQVSKPGVEKKSKKKQGVVIEDRQKKSKKKTKSKKKHRR